MSEILNPSPSMPLRRGVRSSGRLIRSFSPLTIFGGDRDHHSSRAAAGSRNDRRSTMMMAMMKYSSSRNSISTTRRTSTTTSTNQTIHGQSHVAKFHIHEIIRGRRMPADQTTEIYEIVNVKQDHRERLGFEQHARDVFCETVRETRTGTNGSKKKAKKGYVIKHIQKECMEYHSNFESSATSLEHEASLLKNLSHPSIQRLRGQSIGMAEAYYQMGRYDSFFLILDQMEETLAQRIRKWRSRYERSKWPSFHGLIRKKKKNIQFLIERLQVVHEIAGAIKYIHDHDISHGNIRHDQIGFDDSNEVKVCGFHNAGRANCLRKGVCDNCRPLSVDLVTEGHHRETPPDDSIEISHEISPLANDSETASGDLRCMKQDVFDFSQLICEVISMKTSSEANKVCSRSRKGVQGYVREFQTITSPIHRRLLEMIQSGLNDNAFARPTMADYCICLSEAVDILKKDQPTEKLVTVESISSQPHRTSFKRCFHRRRTMFSLSVEEMVESKALSLSCGIDNEGRNGNEIREDKIRQETNEEVTERTDITC